MRRAFWVALGLGAGATAAILLSRWARRQTERVAPAAVARQARGVLADLGTLAREATEAYRRAAAEREAELRAAIGADPEP